MTLSQFRDELRRCSSRAYSSPKEIRERIFATTTTTTCSTGEEAESSSHSNNNKASLEPQQTGVPYYSRQNDCLRQELGPVWEALTQQQYLPATLPWAQEALGGAPPDAINLWVGNERAVSALHKDHYENLFYVASGEKVFTLCPPADAPFLREEAYESGRFEWCGASKEWKGHRDALDVDEKPTTVRWIAADVTVAAAQQDDATTADADSTSSSRLLRRYTHPMQVHVRTSELLYLPALWFHRVTQTCETVGINYWYDMKFDAPGWCYFHLLQQLDVVVMPAATATATATGDDDDDDVEDAQDGEG